MLILQHSYIKGVLDNPFMQLKPISATITRIVTKAFLLKNLPNNSLMRAKMPLKVDILKEKAKRTPFLT